MASGKSKKRPAPPDFAGSSPEATLGGAAKKGKPCNPPPSYKGISPKRCRPLNEIALEDFEGQGNVVYWMSRDQRVQDNWALLYSQQVAIARRSALHVCFCLVPSFLGATLRQYMFMLKGLKEVEQELSHLGIPFHLLLGEAATVLPPFLKEKNISAVVCDFSPLKISQKWYSDIGPLLEEQYISLTQVDAHNIVPVWVASDKQEYAARTIRPKIHKHLGEYLTEFPLVIHHPHAPEQPAQPVDWEKVEASLQVDETVKEVGWATPGTDAGLRMLEEFVQNRLKHFEAKRNDPNEQALSNLSPWLHFGQISIQRCILRIQKEKSVALKKSIDAFTEEAVVRRELAENFCYYNVNYDSIKGGPAWAQQTLKDHAGDKREHVYTQEELEQARTHDDLWNAAQVQMVKEGKMHGFLRMYWAKKILEWTVSPEEALRIAIYLNDRYELDGRDPNGYVGCVWSICGVHDQGWKERSVFGKIRYMNYDGCKRKFDVSQFVKKYIPIS